MISGIYLITNKINGHKYIGGSKDIRRRFNEHKRCSDIESSAIDRAIYKYGADNFSYEIITELPLDWNVIGEHEKYWIKFYNTFKDKQHYNLTPGGDGNVVFGGYWKDKNFSEEHKQKLSDSHKGIITWNKGIKQWPDGRPEEDCLKQSKTKNTSGYYRVSKEKDNTCKQGFIWQYRYYEDGKPRKIRRVNIKDLENEVRKRGLKWMVIK